MEKTYDIADPDVEQLLSDIFEYLLQLEKAETETDDSIKTMKHTKKKDPWNKEERDFDIETIDDSKKVKYNKLYFGGEGDSNQTRYELLSNTLKIAVSAKSSVVGRCLHVFLRTIIDNHGEDWFLCWFEDTNRGRATKKGGRLLTIPDMVDILAELFDNYGNIHDPREKGRYIKNTLRGRTGETVIKRYLCDVDTWDIYRIGSSIGVWSDLEQYKSIKKF